ncbi:DeoR/GlpR transcriptional regulator [bacterium]|nr:DeoR/GlpR transcriptional regulator [bacterium]
MIPRHGQILKLLADGRERPVTHLARRFGVALMTIRRDLAELAATGQLVRTHGGALLARPGHIEFAFQRRGEAHHREKHAIARAAAALVGPGMTVSLDTGTTTLAIARAIAGVDRLKVLTSSLAIAAALYPHENIELVLLGGIARQGSPDLHGDLTEENLRRFRVQIAFLGADAVSPDGCYTVDAGVARVSRAMIANAIQKVLVADHSKFQNTAFRRFAALNDLDLLITDGGAPPATRRWLSRAVRQVVYARPGRRPPRTGVSPVPAGGQIAGDGMSSGPAGRRSHVVRQDA